MTEQAPKPTLSITERLARNAAFNKLVQEARENDAARPEVAEVGMVVLDNSVEDSVRLSQTETAVQLGADFGNQTDMRGVGSTTTPWEAVQPWDSHLTPAERATPQPQPQRIGDTSVIEATAPVVALDKH